MKPKQFFFVVLGILVVIVAGGGAGYYYGLKYLKGQSAKLSTKLAEQRVADEQINSIRSLQHQYNRDILPIIPLINAALPRDKKQTEILAQIERIAANVGLQQPFDSIVMPGPAGLPGALSQTIKAGNVLALPINFEARGSYAQLQAFISKLENLNRYTDITNLSIKHDSKINQPVSYTISLSAYIKP